MVDRYTKVVLTVIAVALMVLAFRPLLEPRPAQAEGPIDVNVVGWSISQINVAASLNSTPIPVRIDQQVPVVCIRGCR